MSHPTDDSPETRDLLQRVRAGDQAALGRLLDHHHAYLETLIDLRMDPRLRGRVDPADVVQQTHVEVVRRVGDYLQREPMPFRVWLRMTACQCLVDLQRHHVDAECRAVGQEMALPGPSACHLAEKFLGATLTPSRQLMRHEVVDRVRQALARLAGDDREIILLRNFEELSNVEAAQVLGVEPAAASKRYGRAMLRLSKVFEEIGLTDSMR